MTAAGRRRHELNGFLPQATRQTYRQLGGCGLTWMQTAAEFAMNQYRCAALAAALFLAGPWAGYASAQSGAAPRAGVQQPSIAGLEVNADAALQPGSVLQFKLMGTPKGQARVQVPGSKLALALAETQPGTYTGSYTVRRDEKGLAPSSLIRGELTVRGKTQVADFSFPPSFGARQAGGTAQGAPTFRIASFTSPLVDKAVPGTELRFTVEGTPAAKAAVQVPGLAAPIELREERPGRYVGTYVLRRADVVKPGPAVATLRSGDRVATAKLGHSLASPAAATAAPAVPAAPTPPAPLAVNLVEPRHGTAVDVAGLAALHGQATPNADVHVVIHAVTPGSENRTSVAQTLLRTTVKADAGGRFSVPMQGVQRPESGSQVHVAVAASRGNERTPDQRIVVLQP